MAPATNPGSGEIARLLGKINRENEDRVELTRRLFAKVYPELRRQAHAIMRAERSGHTLESAALVHEAYLRLVGDSGLEWQSRAHFFGIAARAMRQILVQSARRRAAAKRGGGWERVTLDTDIGGFDVPEAEVLDLDRALGEFAQLDQRAARVVELRIFAGLPTREVAEVLGVSERTVEVDWRAAKLWLKKRLSRGPAR